jgi:glycosyltransferase involved in cell wall biosynthesis
MKIVVAAASFSSSISGLQRHAFNLVHCLLQRPEISALHLIVAPWQTHLLPAAELTANGKLSVHVADMRRSCVSRNLWYYRRLPEIAEGLEANIVHLTYPVPVNAGRFSCPTVVTLHDLYPYEIPRNFGLSKVMFNRAVLQQCLRNVDAIACVSEATRRVLPRYTPPCVWRKSLRVYNCVEAAQLVDCRSSLAGWWGQPFLLCVAQHRRNKNIPVAIKAFARLLRSGQICTDSMLVVVGMEGPETRRIHRVVRTLGLDDSVQFLEGVSDSALHWCYTRCEAVLAPSITEGFGLPVAEALLAGCRVVCSDISALREIGGEHCRYVALKDNADEMFADAIAAALREPKNLPVPLPQFSASALAQEYLNLYRRLLRTVAMNRKAKHASAVQAITERSTL